MAEHDGQAVGFALGVVRDHLWYLSALFVEPSAQGRGLGRTLLERAVAGFPAPGGVAATMAEAIQPLAVTLYARRGMYPRLPVLTLSGRVSRRPPALPAAVEARPLTAADADLLQGIDAEVLGVDRGVDHRWYLSEGRPGWLLERRDRPSAYVYVRLGPTTPASPGAVASATVGSAAALRPADLGLAVRAALTALGDAVVVVAVPAPAIPAQRVLWEAGLVAGPSPGLLLASREFGRFDRYLLGAYGLL